MWNAAAILCVLMWSGTAQEPEQAALRHPEQAEVWRDLAALRFRERRWSEAETAAMRALERDAHDAASWHLLGAARYMQQERVGALAAWNEVGAPTIQRVRVDGARETRRDVVTDAIGLEPDGLLTSDSMRLARRRLQLVPSVAGARVDYQPDGVGSAEVQVSVLEHRGWRPNRTSLGIAGVRALTERRAAFSLASPAGGGEVWEGSYRWWEKRPRAEIAVTTPRLLGLHGSVRAQIAAETQTYASPTIAGAASIAETAREATLSWKQWLSANWRSDLSAGFHHIRERGDFASVGGGLEWRSAGDRSSVYTGVHLWPRVDQSDALSTRVDVVVRQQWVPASSLDIQAHVGWSGADRRSPLALWPGAGTGQGREGLLRGHPLIVDGAIDGPAFAPALALAGVEATRWIGPLARIVGVAAFVDAARVTSGGSGGPPFLVDGGLGLRLEPPGQRGRLRVDFAAGLTERAHAFSMAWEQRID